MNARSLKTVTPNYNKLVELQNLVASHDVSLVAVTETWLTARVLDAEILPQNFSIHRKDREETAPGTRGGGLLLAINSSLHSRRRKDLEASDSEILICELSFSPGSPRLGLVLCYRPPSSDKRLFNRSLETSLQNVAREFPRFCVLGDFNLPDISWSDIDSCSNNADSDFIHLMNSFFLSQLNTIASNINNHVIDLVFSNTPDIIRELCDLHANFPSDHAVLFFNLSCNVSKTKPIERVVYNYKHVDFSTLSQAIINSSLTDILISSQNIDDMWCSWLRVVSGIVEQHVPRVRVRGNHDPPWFDGEARHSINCKNSAWRRAKRTNSEADWAKFRRARNQTTALLRAKHSSYIESLADISRTNPKRFWSFFRQKTNIRSLPKELCDGAERCCNPKEKATLFNRYFCSVFNNAPVSQQPSIPDVLPPPVPAPSFTPDQVLAVLKKLDVNSASPPDDISPVVLRSCCLSLAPSLAVIFSASMLSSTVPAVWKKGNIVPVFKKGDRDSVLNYRPISLLCGVSKVMERCVFDHLFAYVAPVIHPLQHGFIKGRSCCTQLLKVYHDIGSILDNGGQIDIIYLDFSKAFDCISHELLLFKLNHFYGLSEDFLAWISNYLSDRSQRVVVEGVASEWAPVASGVPQGSILGPLLFLLFINDMPSVTSSSTTALFADDSKCFKPVFSTNDCILLQKDLNRLYEWSQTWQMSFNPSKCKVMSITRSRNPLHFDYTLNGVSLEYVDSFTDLGVIVDFNLSFHSHVDSIVNKSSRVCGMIKRSLGYNAPISVKLDLYKSLCRSILESASQVWSPHNKDKIRQVESIQRCMSKYILNDYTSCYTDRCKALKLLPLSYRREYSDLVFVFKVLNGLLNVDFTNEVLLSDQSSHSLRSNNGLTLQSSHVLTECFLSSFFNRVVHLWNILPVDIRSCSTLHCFKAHLASYYFTKLNNYDVFNSCSLTSICRCTGFYH